MSESVLREIAVLAMTAQSDPYADAATYRQALIEVCNLVVGAAPERASREQKAESRDPLGTFSERQAQMLGLAPLPTLAELGGPIDVPPESDGTLLVDDRSERASHPEPLGAVQRAYCLGYEDGRNDSLPATRPPQPAVPAHPEIVDHGFGMHPVGMACSICDAPAHPPAVEALRTLARAWETRAKELRDKAKACERQWSAAECEEAYASSEQLYECADELEAALRASGSAPQ